MVSQKLRKLPPLISFKNVFLQRGQKRVLHDIHLELRQGEHLAILGPNGSGKSSLIKLFTRECYPVADRPGLSTKLFGKQFWNVFDLRARFGIVTADLQAQYGASWTGVEVVISGFFTSIGLWPADKVTPAMRRKALTLLRWLGIASLADRPLGMMSSGEARRTLIARALARDPAALILDEPTTSLDLGAVKEFRETLRKVARAQKSIILVTHDLHDIIPEIKRVILLQDGKILVDGPKEEALTNRNLSTLFQTPVHILRREGYFFAG